MTSPSQSSDGVNVHVSSLLSTNVPSPNEIFRLRKSATHNDAVGTDKPFRWVIHYNIKHCHQDKFWKVRDNLPKAIEKAGGETKVI